MMKLRRTLRVQARSWQKCLYLSDAIKRLSYRYKAVLRSKFLRGNNV